MYCEDIDITPYLMAQTGGTFITGEGVFPSIDLEGNGVSFDLLEVASDMYAEGKTAEADKILKARFKYFKLTINQHCVAYMILYLKYSHRNK